MEAQTVNSNPISCNDLFISEMTFGKANNTNNLVDLNYAIEIFNPTQNPISLVDYKIQLKNNASISDLIILNGTINSGDIYVVSNTNADLNMQGLADQLSNKLDFENNVSLELTHNNITIDRIGEIGTPTLGAFDLTQLFADPYNYLLNFHFDLNDYQTINCRRNVFITNGNPLFFIDPNQFVNEWEYHINSDRSDIGKHVSLCNKPEAQEYIEYLLPLQTITSAGNAAALIVQYSPGCGTFPSFDITHSMLPSGTTAIFNQNQVGYHANFQSSPTTDAVTFSISNPSGIQSNENLYFYNDNFAGTKQVELKLTCNNPNIQVSGFNSIITLKGNPLTISEFEKINYEVFLTLVNSSINILSKKKSQYQIFDIQGKVVDEGIILVGNNTLQLDNLLIGIYCIKLISDKEKSIIYKFVKE